MSVWFQQVDIVALNELHADDINGWLGIEITNVGPDWLEGRMPVDHRTRQPMGLLQGGASVVLAETLGSAAAAHVIDPKTHFCVGQDINANHVRGVRSGWVTGRAHPFHIGRTSHVWGIDLRDDAGNLSCIARLTVAVAPLKR
jgi:1,4-dihydroxy-2-naphthoyl-CoA hydrolase